MIEEGKSYKLKKIKGICNNEEDCTILKIIDSPNTQLGKIAFYQTESGEKFVAPVSEFVDPEDPKEYSDLVIQKIESVIRPMNLSFWKELSEEATCASLGAAPCPAMGQITGGGISAATINGLPVPSKSVKKKKKKNEAVEAPFITKCTPEEMIEKVEETFYPEETLETTVKSNREIIKVSVFYSNPDDDSLVHTLKLEFLDIDEETVIDEVIEEDLTLEDCRDELIYLFSTHEAIDGELYEGIEDIITNLLNEDFNEEYETITDLIWKELDRLNFEYANTEDIIYKKEGDFKYLIKFDNGNGILKFKVSKDKDVIFEKEYQLENEEDVANAFQEIEDVYRSNGI